MIGNSSAWWQIPNPTATWCGLWQVVGGGTFGMTGCGYWTPYNVISIHRKQFPIIGSHFRPFVYRWLAPLPISVLLIFVGEIWGEFESDMWAISKIVYMESNHFEQVPPTPRRTHPRTGGGIYFLPKSADVLRVPSQPCSWDLGFCLHLTCMQRLYFVISVESSCLGTRCNWDPSGNH